MSRMKEITKIRAELNDIETKRKVQRNNNPGAGSSERQTKLTSLHPDSLRKKEREPK